MDIDNNCSQCNTKLKANNSIRCDGTCEKTFHFKCIDLGPKDVQALQSVKGSKWFCESCTQIINLFFDVKKELNEFKTHLLDEFNILKTKVDASLSVEKNKQVSYAKVAKGEAIVIKPKAKQECSKTQETIRENLKPADIEVGITEIRNIKDGGVLLKCNNKEEVKRMKEAVEKKLGKNYQVNMPQKRNPCIKVVGIEEKMDDEELLQCIKAQNAHLMVEKTELKVIISKKMKTRFMAIIECDPTTFQNIMNERTLNIGWSPSCRVFEYVRVYRCFKCAGFNHKSEDCKKTICLKCGDKGHKEEECREDSYNCANCIEANEKLQTVFDVTHSVFDYSCPVLQKRITIEKQKINESSE